MTSPILQFTRKESSCAIQFTSKEKKFRRTCILPMNMNQEAIKEYFASSLYIPIDVVEYLVEIEQRKSALNFNIVAGMNTNEKDIENIFRSYYPRNEIFVDSFKDGWLMRSKKRYGGKNETVTQK